MKITEPKGFSFTKWAKTRKEFERDIKYAFERNCFPLFAKYLCVRSKELGKRMMTMNNWFPSQIQFYEQMTGLDVVNKFRQAGFTTFGLMLDMFYALRFPSVQVLFVSHNQELSKECLGLVVEMYTDLCEVSKVYKSNVFPTFKRNDGTKMRSQKTSFKFHNGSQILVRTAGNNPQSARNLGRGLMIKRLHISEFAMWTLPDLSLDSIMETTPMNETTEILFESTPMGLGAFYNLCKDAWNKKNAYQFHFFEWWHHPEYQPEIGDIMRPEAGPFVPETDIELMLVEKGIPEASLWFWRFKWKNKAGATNIKETMLQNYPIDAQSCFFAGQTAFLTVDQQTKLGLKIREPLVIEFLHDPKYGSLDLKVFIQPVEGRRYILCADIAQGVQRDHSVGIVMDLESMEICAICDSDQLGPSTFAFFLALLGAKYFNACIAPENNGVGSGTCDTLKTVIKYPNLFNNGSGFNTHSEVNRPLLFSVLKQAIEDDCIPNVSKELFDQIVQCEANKKGKIEAAGKGRRKDARDDFVMAYGICLMVRRDRLSASSEVKMMGGRFTFARSDGILN